MENFGTFNETIQNNEYAFTWMRTNSGEIYGQFLVNGESIEEGFYRTEDAEAAFCGAKRNYYFNNVVSQ